MSKATTTPAPKHKKRLKEWLLTTGLVGASLLFTWVCAELVIRLFNLEPYYPGETIVVEGVKPWEPHPLFGKAGKPLARGVLEGALGDFRVEVAMNSRGLRDREYDYAKTRSRILVLGDSFAVGHGVTQDETFSEVLENLFDGRIDVINAAVPGWGTAQQLLWFKEEGVRYDPDLVLCMFFIGNDLNDNFNFVKRRPSALQALGIDHAAATPQADGESSGAQPSRESLKRRIKRLLKRHSAVYRMATERLHYSPFIQELAAKLGWSSHISDRGWPQTFALLQALHGSCIEQGCRLVLVFIPEYSQVSDEFFAQYYGKNLTVDRLAHNKTLKEFSAKEGIDFVDLTKPLRREEARGNPTTFEFDHHWNAHAHQVAADYLHRHLPQLEALPEHDSAGR